METVIVYLTLSHPETSCQLARSLDDQTNAMQSPSVSLGCQYCQWRYSKALTWLFWFPRQKFCRNWWASLINSFILTSSFPSNGICSRSRTTCRAGVKLNMVIISELGNIINVTTSIRNIFLSSSLRPHLVYSHVPEQSLLVFPRLESASKPSLDAHSVHPIENLLDSFIIASLKGNNLVYCGDGLTNRAPACWMVPYEQNINCVVQHLIIEGVTSRPSDLVRLQRRTYIKIDRGTLFLWLAPASRLLLDERFRSPWFYQRTKTSTID